MTKNENKRAYVTLLQSECLGVDNKALLNELHYSDEARLINPTNYSQM